VIFQKENLTKRKNLNGGHGEDQKSLSLGKIKILQIEIIQTKGKPANVLYAMKKVI
jgi:hypothetical protein